MKTTINKIAAEIHELNKKWWCDLQTGEPIQRNRADHKTENRLKEGGKKY